MDLLNTNNTPLTFRSFIYLIFLCLTGCSVSGRYYLRNFLEESITITIEKEFEIPDSNLKSIIYPFENKILDIKYSAYKKLTQQLTPQKIDLKKVQLVIPPRSTVFIAIGSNDRINDVKSIEITTSTEKNTINPENRSKFNTRWGLGRYAVFYDITTKK